MNFRNPKCFLSNIVIFTLMFSTVGNSTLSGDYQCDPVSPCVYSPCGPCSSGPPLDCDDSDCPPCLESSPLGSENVGKGISQKKCHAPPRRYERFDALYCNPSFSKQRKWIIFAGVATAGIVAAIAAVKIWPASKSSCSSTSNPGNNPGNNTGPAQLNFTFSDTSNDGDWTGTVVTPNDTVFTTPALSPLGTQKITIGPPSQIGTYTIVFTAGFSNPAPQPMLSLGDCVVTTSNGSSSTFTAPTENFSTGQEFTFQIVYSPTVFP